MSKDCTQISRIELRSSLVGGGDNTVKTSVKSLLPLWLDEVAACDELYTVGDELSILSSIMKDDNSLVIFLFKQTEEDPEGMNMNGKVLLLIFFLFVTTTT